MALTAPIRCRCLMLLALLVGCAGSGSLPAQEEALEAVRAELPREYVDTAWVEPEGEVIQVEEGGDFQAALDRARPGDVIELEAGGYFEGPFTLPVKEGEDWIVIRGSAHDRLPPAGTRVDPSQAESMPKLVAFSDPVVQAAPGAHHYRFVGIEIHPARAEDASLLDRLRSLRGLVTGGGRGGDEGVFITNLVLLGAFEETIEETPHHIIIDRCYLHGDPERGTRRGVALNSRHSAVIDSWLSGFKEVGADSQAIAGWNGAGPFKIVNNYLEGAGENILFGGATPGIEGLVPSDIEVRHNHFHKPLSWREGHPDYEGKPWSVKNLFELKNARRVLVEGNLFEHNWPHAQNGFAILFTVRNEGGEAPWATIEDVTFQNNVLRGIGSGINILGRDDNSHPSGRATNLVIRNNLFEEVGNDWGGGRLFQFLNGVGEVLVAGNTALNSQHILMSDGDATQRFIFAGNIVMHNEYGIIGNGTGPGRSSINRHFESAVIEGNVIVGGQARNYPGDNAFPGEVAGIGFVDPASGDYRLGEQSPFREAAPGVDFAALCEALAGSDRPASCHESGALAQE